MTKARALILAAVAAAGMASATASSATVIFATSVDAYTEGTGIIDPNRRVTANALGTPDGKFLSLGIGGEAVFSFGKPFGGPGKVIEITFGNRDNHVETADIFGITGMGVETFLASVINTTATAVFEFTGRFKQLRVVDTSPTGSGGSRDGFDIDAIAVSPVPLPAGGLLLLAGLGGLALARRRKAAA